MTTRPDMLDDKLPHAALVRRQCLGPNCKEIFMAEGKFIRICRKCKTSRTYRAAAIIEVDSSSYLKPARRRGVPS